MTSEVERLARHKQIKRDIDRTYSLLRSAIVLAGGCEMGDAVLGKMTVDKLLRMLTPNHIKLHVEYSPPRRTDLEDLLLDGEP